MKLYRQGDVLLVESELPKNAKETPTHNRVLAYGEVTGHKHRLTGSVQMYASEETTYFVADEGTKLVHEEHAVLDVPPATYKVVLQREFDLVTGVRQVLD